MKLQKNSPYSNLNVTQQFELVLNQVLLVDSTSLACSSADNCCSPQIQCISLLALWSKVILDDITSLDRTKKIMRDKKGITSMGLKDNPWEKGKQTKDAEKDSFSMHLAIQQVGLPVSKTCSNDNIMTWELKVYSCNHHPSLDPGHSFTVIKQIHNHVMPLKIPIQPIHTHCIPMHMTLFIGSYANSYHSTNGLERTPSHKPHMDQRTPIPTYCSDKSKWHSTLGGLCREKQFKNKTLIRLPHAIYIWWPCVW